MSRLVLFNDTATTQIYTLSLHDALPIFPPCAPPAGSVLFPTSPLCLLPSFWFLFSNSSIETQFTHHTSHPFEGTIDRKSTRLNSSHANISYAVFCLKKKNTH